MKKKLFYNFVRNKKYFKQNVPPLPKIQFCHIPLLDKHETQRADLICSNNQNLGLGFLWFSLLIQYKLYFTNIAHVAFSTHQNSIECFKIIIYSTFSIAIRITTINSALHKKCIIFFFFSIPHLNRLKYSEFLKIKQDFSKYHLFLSIL